ncbi:MULTISPECIES: glycosyltransferase family 4 protein [unclassified Microcoleus]|uniref:glycosyltransferase family 4 protein n=1 Tax=unclassified Microcoleus TaxID=2642155 RepID=UPI002FD0C0AB
MNSLLIVTTIPATLQAFLLPFALHFRKKGWKVDAMAQGISESAECLQAFDRVWDVKWSRNPLDPRNLILAPQIIREVVAQEAYDIIHVHTPVAAFVTRYALKDLKKQAKFKVIYTAHGFHFYRGGKPLKNTVFLNLEKLAGAWTDYLVVINREDEEAAKRYGILPSERVRYMPGIGVDIDYYSPDAISETDVKQVRQEMGITQENPLFLSVAEFIPRKHHRDVILAFAKLERSQVHLALAGDGPLMSEMRQLASDLKVEKRVHFLGERRDIPTLSRASAATLLASEQEGLPRCVMESFCLEIPVIGTDIRGIQDLLEGDCGFLIKVGDVEKLAEAMAWILDHPEDALAMGKRGRSRMATHDLQNIIKLHETLYNEAMHLS